MASGRRTSVKRAVAPGYSGKTLADKLGLKPATRIAVIHGPKELPAWLAPLPKGAKLVGGRSDNADCVLHFASSRAPFAREMTALVNTLPPGAVYWICWPKKSSGVATDISEDLLRALVLPTGWVDVKVCAVSEVWSGLKFLRRRS
ncbi:MAG TPA: DUF3052 domain-containing protein [Gemmatimonadales bacterium]|jgi:hypothetical protein